MVSRDATGGQKLQRAIALLQLLLNANFESMMDIEDEVRQQLEEWGVKVPEFSA